MQPKDKEKETQDLKNTKIKELKSFNASFDIKYGEEMTKLDNLLNDLQKKHEQELKDYFSNFEKNYPKEMKPSNELIEKQKQLEYYIKIEE